MSEQEAMYELMAEAGRPAELFDCPNCNGCGQVEYMPSDYNTPADFGTCEVCNGSGERR